MRYAYKDLGRQGEGCAAVIRWGGSAGTVMLFDPVNFTKYVERLPCSCDGGGHYRCSPARLTIPRTGRWFVVVDLGRYGSAASPTVEVELQPAGARGPESQKQALVS